MRLHCLKWRDGTAETDDRETCNAILEASNIIVPAGSLSAVYDERGFLYNIPDYCLSDPVS